MSLEKFIIIGLCILYFICLNFIFWYAIYLFILTKKYCFFNNLNSENLHQSKSTFKDSVLIQLPVYNEKYVIERLIDSVCKIEYPRNLLQIDILDDSDDNTSDIIKSKVSYYQKSGININHKTRKDRKGYKAGALDFFMKKSNADFIVIFDADFIPPKDFILKLIPYFDDQNIGMIQSKWGHLNKDQSILTSIQAFALNFHFTIEQLVYQQKQMIRLSK